MNKQHQKLLQEIKDDTDGYMQFHVKVDNTTGEPLTNKRRYNAMLELKELGLITYKEHFISQPAYENCINSYYNVWIVTLDTQAVSDIYCNRHPQLIIKD